jgi:hypothetical protein
MRWPRNLSGFETDVMFSDLPGHPSIAPVTVSGFTRYKTHVADLPATERAKVAAVAERIVNGYRAGFNAIVGVLLVGYSRTRQAKPSAPQTAAW